VRERPWPEEVLSVIRDGITTASVMKLQVAEGRASERVWYP